MKKFLVFLLFLSCAILSKAQTASIYHTIELTWLINGSSCSTILVNGCIENYTEILTPPSGVTGGAVTIVPNGTALLSDWTPGGLIYCGTWNYSLVANWRDNSGIAISSVPAIGTVVVPCPFIASPVTGVKTVLK